MQFHLNLGICMPKFDSEVGYTSLIFDKKIHVYFVVPLLTISLL